MRLWLALFLLITNLPFTQMQSDSQAAVQFSDLAVSYQFGQQATFQAQVTPADQVKDVFLFLQQEGETTRTEKVPVDASGAMSTGAITITVTPVALPAVSSMAKATGP